MRNTPHLFAIPLCLLLACGCSTRPSQPNTLSDQEKDSGWTLLFDGKTLNGWHLFNRGSTPSAWSVDSGTLVCNPHAKDIKHGDLVTDKAYENFDLLFEWKISTAGNSGLFIDVQERPDLGTTFSTGPEYQLLDDKNVDPDYLKNLSHKAAAIFGVIPNTSNTIPKPGEWNQSRILQQAGRLTFWLNGVLTVQVDLKSDDWKQRVAASSMSKFPEFGVATSGHLAVQDWTNGVAFRNIKIRDGSTSTTPPPTTTSAPPTTSATPPPTSTPTPPLPGADTVTLTDTINLQANDNMRFDRELFKIKANKKITLILHNTGAHSIAPMAHNVVILKPNVDIADFAAVAQNAKDEQYIPSAAAELIIAHTKLVNPGNTDEVEFTISTPGIYDFICSYPGHWGTMQGKIIVE